MLKQTYFLVKYKLRGSNTLEQLREDNIKDAYSFMGSIRRLCTHTEIEKVLVYDNSLTQVLLDDIIVNKDNVDIATFQRA